MAGAAGRLILGAGRKAGHFTAQPTAGDVTIDKLRSAGADHTLDLTVQRIPYPDGHFGEVYFEFFPNDQLLKNGAFALKEAARVTNASGGILLIDTGLPGSPLQVSRLKQQIRDTLRAESFAVREMTRFMYMRFEATRGIP